MKKLYSSAIVAAALLAALSAQAQNIAIVNGKPVPKSRVDALTQQIERSGRPITPDMKQQLKDDVITGEIFMQEAKKRGLDTSEDYKNQLEFARQGILIRELFVDFQKKNPVTDAEIQAAYDKFMAGDNGKEYKASHILVEKEDEAKSIIAQLKKGAKFEDIAKKLSKDPSSGANGGDLDWATPNTYVKEFADTLVKLKKGETTDAPLKTKFGWHIIRLDDIREAKPPKLEDVKPQIAQQLQQKKLFEFQEKLRTTAKVE